MSMEQEQKVEGTSSGTSALSAGLGAMTHFWCEVCDAIQPAFFEGANHQDTSGDFVGGDVVCSVCAFIVATAYTPNLEGNRLAALSPVRLSDVLGSGRAQGDNEPLRGAQGA